jgi:integrase
MMQARCEIAGIKISPHAFRRAFAVRWREAEGSTSGLMAHAGCSSEAMVRKYSRMASERLAQLEYDRLFNP